jgi:hypothetical protein
MSEDLEQAPSPTSQYWFTLEGSGLGETTYRVAGAGDLTRLRVRYEATEWQRTNVHSCSDDEWQRDVVGAINLLVDANGGRRVPQDVVDAFNAWRLREYNSHRRQIDAQPERYGIVDWDKDPVFKRPAEVRGARYRVRWEKPGPDCWKHGCVGLGWELNPTNAQDRLYVEQGYELPEGMTWEIVDAHRQQHGLDPRMVPVARAHGVLAWAVPLNRPDRAASVPRPRGAEP